MLNDPINIVWLLTGAVSGWFGKYIQDRISAKRLFDHRIRLEKEYALYSELWDKLFELRRAVNQLVETLGSTNVVRHDKQIIDLFNAYQGIVSRGEPFMSASVFTPARRILSIARQIISNTGEKEYLSESVTGGSDPNWVTAEQCKLDRESDTGIKEIEELFQEVAKSIRRRVSP